MPIDATIGALADSTRRELLRRLADKPCRAGELARGVYDQPSGDLQAHADAWASRSYQGEESRARANLRARAARTTRGSGIDQNIRRSRWVLGQHAERVQTLRGGKPMTIRKSIRVERSPEVVFRVFTEEIGKWWPLKEGFSFGRRKSQGHFYRGPRRRQVLRAIYRRHRIRSRPHHRVSAAARCSVHLEGSRVGRRRPRSKLSSRPTARALASSSSIADGSRTRHAEARSGL